MNSLPGFEPPTPNAEEAHLLVRAGVAQLDRPPSPALAETLTAIPGAPLDLPGGLWGLRLGPDRAESLVRIAEALSVAIDSRSAAELGELRARRDRRSPVIEITRHSGGVWLSLMEDWRAAGLADLRLLPVGRPRDEAARFEVPLDRDSAATVHEITQAHAVQLSPAADLALRELLEQPDAGRGLLTLEKNVGFATIAAAPDSPLGLRCAALTGARALSQPTGRWLIPETPQAAAEIRQLAARHPELAFDTGARQWLADSPEWIARVEIDSASGAPSLRVITLWGDRPSALAALPGVDRGESQRLLAFTPANVRALGRLRSGGPDLHLASAVDRSLLWLEEHPDAEVIPPAELDLVVESGVPRFTVEAIADEDAEGAFVQWEVALLRRYCEEAPGTQELPAGAWPPDMLAQFIKLWGVTRTPAAARLVDGLLADETDADRLLALSSAADADIVVEGLGGELMAFQRAGVAYAMERRRVFLADEQGLGKTIQALATVQAAAAFPAIVICPASLKLNWLREAQAWLPGRSTMSIAGRSPRQLGEADIVVVNYEVVGAHGDALAGLEPAALILDESHYVKNPRAGRTRAVIDLADRLGPDALRLALTGTPIVNHPGELASQLRALDRLSEYGSARSFKHGYRTDRERRALHRRLRSSCYLRRRKQDVLDQLPDKRRAVVTVPLDNEREYKLAETDFVRWLNQQLDAAGEAKLAQATRAQALVRMNALRRLAARGKLAAALAWLSDFRESEERLVVFAHHRDIQAAVLERFPDSARIVGSDTVEERESNVRRFQEPEGPPMCVCSLEVGSHGFTLTAAANVAFLELAWTPAKHDQAEDRTHRIGQTNAVTAWYLLAAETIDERIAEILEAKRGVVDSVTDGGGSASSSLVDALIAGYRT